MITFAGFLRRNPSYVTHNAREAWEVAKVMKKYRLAYPTCEWCGRMGRIQVHHIQPVSVAPEKAADWDNLMTLCAKRCHITVGHMGNYANSFIGNAKQLCFDAKRYSVSATKPENDE